MIEFEVFEGVQSKGLRSFSRGAIRLGSHKQSDLVMTGLAIGGFHAEVLRRSSGYFVCDQGHLAGTRVNGRLVTEYGPLAPEDELVLGRWRLKVRQIHDTPQLISAPEHPVHDEQDAKVYDISRQDDPLNQPHQAGDTAEALGIALRRLRAVLDSRRRDWGELSDQALRDETLSLIRQELVDDLARMAPEQADRFCQDLVSELVGFGPIERLMQDPEITEIMVNGPDCIFVERSGRCQPSSLQFSSADALRRVIERMFLPLARRIDDGNPMADGRLADGSRVNAVLSPPAMAGPCLTIRRFSDRTLDLAALADRGALSSEMVAFLADAVGRRRNIVVTGGTGSGKTTVLKALARLIPSHERVITIEDAAELRLQAPNLVALEAREPNQEGQGAITIRDLVRNALRMRPDRIIVGECRGGEALDMLQAMNTGHEGSLTTVHANTPRDALARIEVMVLMAGFDLPLRAIREQIAASVQLVVHQQRGEAGRRRIQQICAVTGLESGVIQLETLFQWSEGRYISPSLGVPAFTRESQGGTDAWMG